MPKQRKAKCLTKCQKKEVRELARKAIVKMGEPNFHIFENQGLVTTTASILDMTTIAQAINDQGRIGDELQLTSMQFKYDWVFNAAQQRARVIIFRWLDDSAPVVNDILFGVTSVPRVYAGLAKDRREKFQVLYDKVSVGSLVPSSNSIRYHEKSRKLTGTVKYDAGTTGGMKHIYLLAISDATSSFPELTLYSRFNYLA